MAKRGVDFCFDSVAPITEWDTSYGRRIVHLIEDAFFRSPNPEEKCGSSNAEREGVKLMYLRGLAGDLPPHEKEKNEEEENKSSRQPTSVEQKKAYDDHFMKMIERPDGKSQYDYLRRLEYELEDIASSRRIGTGYGIQAIGVLGSDVFDKLFVLRALKSAFPNVIFFTTDYNSMLLLPSELPYTRNLIVASGYSDRLSSKWQKEIPQFRSYYQTSAFLATQVIV